MPTNDDPNVQEKPVKKAKSKKKKIFLFILLTVVVLGGISAGAYFYFNKPALALNEPKKASAPKAPETESVDMGEMVVNLKGGGDGHYLRVQVTLEYHKEKKLSEEIKKKRYLLSDAILTTLRSKTIDDVRPAGAFDGLKTSLLKELNKNLENGQITGIYFTDYLVQ